MFKAGLENHRQSLDYINNKIMLISNHKNDVFIDEKKQLSNSPSVDYITNESQTFQHHSVCPLYLFYTHYSSLVNHSCVRIKGFGFGFSLFICLAFLIIYMNESIYGTVSFHVTYLNIVLSLGPEQWYNR